ncbi:hypothetical protein CRE_29677 [Caenorhabditis remanei]|uniref:Uncharacterized protein n=1 Tax=Caenorhabditis remanei TaxID=31234 RepID=E3LV59_CAERE|nr:hypothetical protein CRE_29677 [Caenorhabditis remanei]
MSRVDLNQSIWGCAAKNHFFIHSGVRAALSLTLFLSFIDYVNLPLDASPDLKGIFLGHFTMTFLVYFTLSMAYLLLLFCPNQIWYGICMALEGTRLTFFLYRTTYKLIGFGLTQEEDKHERELKKYYTCENFLYIPKRSSDLYVVRVTSPSAEQATDIAIDSYGNSYIRRGAPSPDPEESGSDSDENSGEEQIEKDHSGSRKSRKSQKSKKPQRSQKSTKMEKTQENTDKSSKSQKRKESSSKSTRSKSSKSLKNLGENSLNSDEKVTHIAF